MKNIDDFLKKNFNKYHIIGVVLGVGLSMIYWAKVGRFVEGNILKSNPILMAVWGILIGYISLDMVSNAINRKNNGENN